jgi:ZIP family zinc transporter
MSNTALAFLMCALAGISTVIGSIISLFAKRTSKGFLSFALSFSAGVMIYASLTEIMNKSVNSFNENCTEKQSSLYSCLCFLSGVFVILIIEKLLPENADKLNKTGIYTAFAMGIHNFPEGLATFVSALKNPVLAIPITLAIAIHNIPEGIAVSVPIYFSTGNKKKAFIISFLSGVAEPIGAVIGYLLLRKHLNDTVFGILFGFVAGIMTFISLTELIPSSIEDKTNDKSVSGMISGMAVMALSLYLFK